MERINRDLTKVIVIDWNSSWTQLQPNNTLIIPRWDGDDNDNSLIDLADFLKGFNIFSLYNLFFKINVIGVINYTVK